jgi:hypothetical protein
LVLVVWETRENQNTATIILDTLAKPARGVLSTGWSGLGTDRPLPEIFTSLKILLIVGYSLKWRHRHHGGTEQPVPH